MNHPPIAVSPQDLQALYTQTAALLAQLEQLMQAAGAGNLRIIPEPRQDNPPWTAEQAGQLVFNPSAVMAAPPYAAWVSRRGGLREIYRRLLRLPLRDDLRALLEAIVTNPGKTNLFYASQLHIERSTFYHRKHRLAAALHEFINAGELDQPLQ